MRRSARSATTPRRCTATVVVGIVAVLAVGCGDDSENAAASSDTVTLDEWVEQFDRACIAAAQTLSDSAPSMSDAELVAFNEGAFTILGALKPPDDKADTAAELVDDLRGSLQPGLDDDQLAALEQRVLQTMTDLGISDQCTGGVPG